MCGICGFYQQEKEAENHILKEMNNQLVHRGPDDEGFFFSTNGRIGLAARRLSIIDLQTGHQPLSSQSGNSWITYNGEVYNFKELRQELQSMGFQFKTQSDTEVIVNLYEAFGIEFVKKLRGMFAIGIYDQKNDKIILARDHNGVKPLYYCIKNNKNLIFGSELKAILAYPGIDRELDHEALDLFLTLDYIPAPFSIYQSIRKLPAAHILVYEKGKIQIQKYWDVSSPNKIEKCIPMSSSMGELKEEFISLLEESVRMRMISDVPLGAFLSGGVDSSAIVAFMSRLSPGRIKTFSIGFNDPGYSELPYSQLVAAKFGTEHHTRILSPDISKLVLDLSYYTDEPLGDFSNFPTYLVSKTAREQVTVALSGDGGDEIWGGYEHYIAQKLARFIDFPLCRPFHNWIGGFTRLFPPSPLKKGLINRLKRFGDGLNNSFTNRHFPWMIYLSQEQKKRLYSPVLFDEKYMRPLPERPPFDIFFKESARWKGINRDLFLDWRTYMVDDILVKVDRMSMATSLEARVPLMDYKIVEFAFSLPSHLKVKGITGKYFLKKAMEGILPDEIIYRRKEGFASPIKNWLKGPLKELMLEYLSEKRVKESGLFQYSYIKEMIDAHLNNKQDHSHRLWNLIQLFIFFSNREHTTHPIGLPISQF